MKKTMYAVTAVLTATAMGLYLLESIFYPGIVQKYLLISPHLIPAISLCSLLLTRLITRETLQDKTIKLIYASAIFTLFLFMIFFLLNKIVHVNYVFSRTHLHALGIQYLGIYQLVFSFLLVSKDYLKRQQIFLISSIPFLSIVLMHQLSIFNESIFWHMQIEDSLQEWLTFVAYATCVYLSGLYVYSLKKISNSKLYFKNALSVFFLIGVVAFFVIAGEEISWAQRIIGFETPEHISQDNTQFEFNIHNNSTVFRYVYKAYLAIALYSSLSWLALRALKAKTKNKELLNTVRLFIPHAKYIGYFIPMIVYVYIRMTYGDKILDKWEEFFELLLVLGIVLFLLENYNKVIKKLVDKN